MLYFLILWNKKQYIISDKISLTLIKQIGIINENFENNKTKVKNGGKNT